MKFLSVVLGPVTIEFYTIQWEYNKNEKWKHTQLAKITEKL